MVGQALRAKIETMLGTPRVIVNEVVRVGASDCHGWVLEDLIFRTSNGPIPAFFLRPPDGHARVAALLYAHAHGNNYAIGRDELTAGRPALHAPYAAALVRLGVASLCLEMPAFGARQLPSESARAKAALWHGETLWGQMLGEQRAGLDWLERHRAIDADRLGVLGLSMGGTLAFWLAGLDLRVRAAVSLCAFADLRTLVQTGAHDLHGLYMSVPGLLKQASTGQIAGLAAPRALMVATGGSDPLTPPDAYAIAQDDLRAAFAQTDADDMLTLYHEAGVGHVETPSMRAAALDFLGRHLKRPDPPCSATWENP